MKIRILALFFVVLLMGVGFASATVSYDTNFLYSNEDRTLNELYNECVANYGESFTNSDLLEKVDSNSYIAKKHIKANGWLTIDNNSLGIVSVYAVSGTVRIPLNGNVHIINNSKVYTHGVDFYDDNGVTKSNSIAGVIQTFGNVENSTLFNLYKIYFGQSFPIDSTIYSEGQVVNNNHFYNISSYTSGDGLQSGFRGLANNFTFTNNLIEDSTRGFRSSVGSNSTFENNTFNNIGPLTESTSHYAFQWSGRYNTIDGLYIDRVGYSGTNIGGEYWNIQNVVCNDTRHNNLEFQVRHSIINNIVSTHADDHQLFTTINIDDAYGESFNNIYSNITTSHGGSGFGILIAEGGHDHIIKDSFFTGPGIGITGSYNITIDNVTQWKASTGLQSTYVGAYDEYPYNINISNSEFKLNTALDFSFSSTTAINLLNVGYASKYMSNSTIDSEIGTYTPTIIWNTESSKYDINIDFLNSNNGVDSIDNEWVPTSGTQASTNPQYGYWYRIPFIPNSTGALTHVSLRLSKYKTPNDGIEIEIMDNNSNIIGSKSMPVSSVPTSHDIAKHKLDTSAWIEQNETYYIVIRSNQTPPGDASRYYLWRYEVPYTGPISGTQTSTNQGSTWSDGSTQMVSFRTHINPDYPVGTYNVIEEAEDYFSFILSNYHNVESVNMSFNFTGSSIALNDSVDIWHASNDSIIGNTSLSNFLGNFELSLDEGGYYVGVYSEPEETTEPLVIVGFFPLIATIPITEGTSQTFEITVNNASQINWYVNTVLTEATGGLLTDSLSYGIGQDVGEYNVTVTCNDGVDVVSKTWTLTISEASTPVTPSTPSFDHDTSGMYKTAVGMIGAVILIIFIAIPLTVVMKLRDGEGVSGSHMEKMVIATILLFALIIVLTVATKVADIMSTAMP